jgi:hypothetical protein
MYKWLENAESDKRYSSGEEIIMRIVSDGSAAPFFSIEWWLYCLT